MRRAAAILVVCSAALFSPPIEAGESQRASRSAQLSVAVRLVSACSVSVSVDGLLSGSDLDRLALLSCPSSVSYRATVAGDPSGTSAADAVAPSADPTAQYTVSVEF